MLRLHNGARRTLGICFRRAATSRSFPILPEQVDHYHEYGWCIPAFEFGPSELSRHRAALDRLLSANPDVTPEGLVNAHLSDGSGGIVKGDDDFLALGADPALSEIASAVLETSSVLLWACHVFCKPGGTGRSVPFHQDGQYWPIEPLRATTLWVALDDSDVLNGCLQVLSGSHLEGELPHEAAEADAALDLAVRAESLRSFDAIPVPIELVAGQLSVHDPMLVHGSAKNRSSCRRAGIAFHYMAASSHFVRDGAKSTQAASESFGYGTRPLVWICGEECNPLNTLVRDMRPLETGETLS